MSASFKVTSPAPRDVWWDLLKEDALASIYQTPTWQDCICEYKGCQDASRLYETDDGRKIVLPMVSDGFPLKSLQTEQSWPRFWDSGGVVAPDGFTPEDAMMILEDLADRPILRTFMTSNPLRAEIWEAAKLPENTLKIPHQLHILDLRGGCFDDVWMKGFGKSMRHTIRKAERSGKVTIECDTTGKLLPVYYDLYLEWTDRRADERSLPHGPLRWMASQRDSLRKLQIISNAFGEAFRTWVAWVDGRAVASILQLIYGHNCHGLRSASILELAGPTDANKLLQKSVIEDACNAGCQYYHIGESGGKESLIQYKERFGAVQYTHIEYLMERLPITRTVTRITGGEPGPLLPFLPW